MKYVCCIFVLAVCIISASKAVEFRAPCDPKETPAQCLKRVSEVFEGTCSRIIPGSDIITIQQCGIVRCEGILKEIKLDSSKPYPDCCQKCEAV